MSLYKHRKVIFLSHIILILLLFAIFGQAYNLFELINLFSYVSAIYLFLLVFLFIVRGRFFDGLMFAMRRARYSFSKQKDHLSELDKKKNPSDKVNLPFYKFVRFQGIGLLIILLVLLGIYYI